MNSFEEINYITRIKSLEEENNYIRGRVKVLIKILLKSRKNINNKNKGIMYENVVNKKCVVRSYDAGVYFGTVTEVNNETVKIENVRNIWYWEGANCLSQIAIDGIKKGKVSQTVSSMVLNHVCQIIPCTDKAIKNLEEISVWKY